MKRDERAVLVERRALSPDTYLLFFESPTLHSDFAPGQFTMVRIPGAGSLLRRPFSFCGSDPEARRFSLLVKVVGEGTRHLVELPVGQGVDCLGPLGTSFKLPEDGDRAVVVAGGVGIAPFVHFCRQLSRQGREATVLLGGRREQDLYLREEFERLGMLVRCATEDGSYGHKGVATDLLSEVLSQPGNKQHRFHLYSCGPSGMLKGAARLAKENGTPHQVSIERRMGCGMGCCWGCVVFTRRPGDEGGEYRRSCTDGPVFDAEEICWERDPHPL
jgi:dihydroorotate dehydrogenase electron transfer subunit